MANLQAAPQISIIVPVYNVENYLHQCLDSVIAQTYTDWECLLVDDGSTDKSGRICDKYVQSDGRFKVWHQNNAGSSCARNEGLKHVRGDYVFFLDSDDWIDNNHLSNLIDSAKGSNADLVFCAYYKETTYCTTYCPNKPSGFNSETLINDFLRGNLHAGLWNKLVKRVIIERNSLCFPRYNYYEDMYFSTALMFHVKRIEYCSEATYHYRFNPDSMTFSNDYEKRIRMYKEFEHNMIDMFDTFNLWKNKEMVNNLYYIVNYNKIRLFDIPYTNQIKNILVSSFPDSIKHFRIKGRTSFLNYLALKYNMPFFRKMSRLLTSCKVYVTMICCSAKDIR